MTAVAPITVPGGPLPVQPGHPDGQTVTAVRHWTDRLFSFRVTRPRSLRFRSGEFLMIGLDNPPEVNRGKPILRAYSIASPVWDEEIEFYSIKVADGPLTSRLQKIAVGDEVIVRAKPVGTLVLDALRPGKRLVLVATGTGIAPFASLTRDPDVYEQFDEVVLTHTCRDVADLAYGYDLVERAKADPLVGELATEKLTHLATTTQETSPVMGRITELLTSGAIERDHGIAALGPDDRVMICGSIGLNKDMAAICEAAGLSEGANSKPGEYVVEKAFVG
ncbi:ferredoxin--NADP reductase [Rhizobiaceae bacterium]|nr:ferredoxin--NADP reductase [Rhizobiaceae bacterium]